jgi:CheY-like chemotaxis protein
VHVLVVEDELPVARVVADSLEGEGHRVTLALDGHDALAYLAHSRPDLVLLDVHLGDPGAPGGIDVLRHIRERHGDLPVVLFTGRATGDDVQAARDLGVIDVIAKPFPLARLSAVLADGFPRR